MNKFQGEKMDNILVSISCTAYNHEKYIAKAIESFLMQKANFDFEILIHDDASTDETAKIIKQYELRYPEKIKVIYQKENQYSKGIKGSKLNLQRALGKYIAICEGDDYWVDSLKLQKQVDFMERNPNCSLCVHGGYLEKKGIKEEYKIAENSRYISTEAVIAGGGGLFLTNSMFYRTNDREDMPEFLKKCSVGDYPLAIHLALKGNVYYLENLMSVYRLETESSWSSSILKNESKRIKHSYEMVDILNKLDEFTDNKYKSSINVIKNQYLYVIYTLKREYKKMKLDTSLYSNLNIKEKAKVNVNLYAPWLRKLYLWFKKGDN